MATVHSLTTAPIYVYSKIFWTGFIQAVTEEAAYELGIHAKINPEAVQESSERGWSASLFTPNILHYTDNSYVDQSTIFDLSSRTTTHVHHHHHAAPSSPEPTTEAGREAKKKKEEEESLQKYKGLGPIIAAIGAFLSTYTWRGYERCKATHDYTQQVRHDLCSYLDIQWTPLKLSLERIVAIKLKVDNIRYKTLYRYFLACAGILVGGGLLTLGAYTGQPRLIPWGEIALAVSAIWAAASAGFHWQDNKDIRRLYGVIALDQSRLADNALHQLYYYYQEGMTLLPQYVQNPQNFVGPGVYPPFFNGAEFNPAPPPSFVEGYSPSAAYAAPSAPPYEYSEQPRS